MATSTETAGTGASATETPVTSGSSAAGSSVSGASLGTVADAIVDLQTGKIRYYILTAANSGQLVPVPASILKVGTTGSEAGLLTSSVNSSILSQAPSFSAGSFPNSSMTGWDTQVTSYWQSYSTTP